MLIQWQPHTDTEEFTKILKNCITCISATKADKKAKIADSRDIKSNNNKIVSVEDVYNYFVGKYKIEIALEDVIDEITEGITEETDEDTISI